MNPVFFFITYSFIYLFIYLFIYTSKMKGYDFKTETWCMNVSSIGFDDMPIYQ